MENDTSRADAVLQEIERLTKDDFFFAIGPEKGRYLVDAVKSFNVKRVLEVGTLVGYSAILIAANLPGDGKVFTIDNDASSVKLARKNITKAGLTDKIVLHTGDAAKLISQIHETFDMVFLDAAKDEYLEYLKLSEPKLKKGGVVFADNVKAYGSSMRDFLKYVRTSGKYRSRFIDLGFDGVELSIKQF
jgi:predicted O-methyltransferase YrrM